MKVAIAATILLASLLICGTPASATFTAGELQAACPTSFEKSHTMTVQNAVCIGYVSGWLDGINGSMVRTEKEEIVGFRLAQSVTTKQVIRVFLKYVADHPETENKEAEEILILALVEARLVRFVPVAEASQTQ